MTTFCRNSFDIHLQNGRQLRRRRHLRRLCCTSCICPRGHRKGCRGGKRHLHRDHRALASRVQGIDGSSLIHLKEYRYTAICTILYAIAKCDLVFFEVSQISEKEKPVPSEGVETLDAEAEGALRRRRENDVLVASSARRHTGEDELQRAGTKDNAIVTNRANYDYRN